MFEPRAIVSSLLPSSVQQLFHHLLAESIQQTVSSTTTVALQLQEHPWHGGGWGWGWGFGFLWPLFWLVILGGVVYLLTRKTGTTNENDTTNGDRALGVLRERYARGDIEEDEFEERASWLRNRP